MPLAVSSFAIRLVHPSPSVCFPFRNMASFSPEDLNKRHWHVQFSLLKVRYNLWRNHEWIRSEKILPYVYTLELEGNNYRNAFFYILRFKPNTAEMNRSV